MDFINKVFFKSLFVGVLSCVLPLIALQILEEGFLRLTLIFVIAFLSTGLAIYFIGLTDEEKNIAKSYFYKATSSLKY